jgi:hypothetical protein
MKIAYCGDCCDHCPRYTATLNGSMDKLKEAAILMKKVGWRHDIGTPEKMICNGCQDIESCEYGVKECCLEKNIENCGVCSDYPCSKIQNAFEITRINAEKFKKILSNKEYETFHKAFFLKKENLDKLRNRI